MITIKIDAIQYVMGKVIAKLKEDKILQISFENDQYWQLEPFDSIDFSKEPQLQVGSIKDDVNFLELIASDKLNADYLVLEKLASILNLMSVKLA